MVAYSLPQAIFRPPLQLVVSRWEADDSEWGGAWVHAGICQRPLALEPPRIPLSRYSPTASRRIASAVLKMRFSATHLSYMQISDRGKGARRAPRRQTYSMMHGQVTDAHRNITSSQAPFGVYWVQGDSAMLNCSPSYIRTNWATLRHHIILALQHCLRSVSMGSPEGS